MSLINKGVEEKIFYWTIMSPEPVDKKFGANTSRPLKLLTLVLMNPDSICWVSAEKLLCGRVEDVTS